MNHVLVLVALKSEITLSWNAISGSVFFLCGRPLQNFMNNIFSVTMAQNIMTGYWQNIAKQRILSAGEFYVTKNTFTQRVNIVRPLKFLH